MHDSIIPNRPRVIRTLRLARQFIKDYGICKLPVDPFQIYEDKEWALFTCKEIEEIRGLHDPLNIHKSNADAKTYLDEGIYITVYNDNYLHSRVRWTLAHEIAHIKLGHLTDFPEICIYRSGISNGKYKVLEREANIFAAELLAPMAILKFLGVKKSCEIIQLCEISKDAADNREKDIQWHGDKKIYYESNEFFKEQFKEYLNMVTFRDNNVVDLSLVSYKRDEKEVVGNMTNKLSNVPVDANGRFLECPRCGKNDFTKEAKYCTLCGLWLFNSCSNTPVQFIEYCSHVNPGDARYCEICGAQTYLMQLGLLETWEETLEKRKKSSTSVKRAEIHHFKANENKCDLNL